VNSSEETVVLWTDMSEICSNELKMCTKSFTLIL